MATHKAIYQALTGRLEDQKLKLDEEQPKPEEGRHAYAIDHIKIPDPEYMSEVPEHLQNKEIPGFPTTVLVCGPPGKGKSNLLINMITKKIFWGQFFDKIYLLGPTVKSDKLFKGIILPEDQIVNKEGEFISKLIEWTEKQQEAVKNDNKTAPKVLFIFEDITAYRDTVQKDPNFAKCFTTIRHHKANAYANIHKYCSLERTARVNCMHIIIFPCNAKDQKTIFEEYGGSYVTDVEDFREMMRYAWEPTKENKKPFFYINMYAEEKQRFRKCFSEILIVDHFDGKGRAQRKKRRSDAEIRWGAAPEKKNKKGERGVKRKQMDIPPEAQDPTQDPKPGALKKLKQDGPENTDGPFGSVPIPRSVAANPFAFLK